VPGCDGRDGLLWVGNDELLGLMCFGN
jgi:hypothetical protein